MTTRLQEAIKLAKALPPEEQDRIAALLLDCLGAARPQPGEVPSFEEARRRALEYLDRGFRLGGKPLSRDEVHQR